MAQVPTEPSMQRSPYCSDPDCKYRKELGRAQEQLKREKYIPGNRLA